jgi:hypothetical protein
MKTVMLLLLCISGYATERAYYDFENVSNLGIDTLGNYSGVHINPSGALGVTGSPMPLIGSRCFLRNQGAASYISLPTSAFSPGMYGAGGSGSFGGSFKGGNMNSFFSNTTQNLFTWTQSAGGPCGIYLDINALAWRYIIAYPTAAGRQVVYSSNQVYVVGKWYTTWMAWDAAGVRVYQRDTDTETTTLIYTFSGTHSITAPTGIYTGASPAEGIYSGFAMDNFFINDAALILDSRASQYRKQLQYIQFGSSHVQQTSCSVFTSRNRIANLASYNGLAVSSIGMNYVGSELGETPLHEGVSGLKSADGIALLKTDWPKLFKYGNPPTSDFAVLCGPFGGDFVNSSAVVRTNMNAFCAAVTTLAGADCNMGISNMPIIPGLGDVTNMNIGVLQAYNDQVALGNHVFFLDTFNHSPTRCADNIHQDAPALFELGEYIYWILAPILNPSVPIRYGTWDRF